MQWFFLLRFLSLDRKNLNGTFTHIFLIRSRIRVILFSIFILSILYSSKLFYSVFFTGNEKKKSIIKIDYLANKNFRRNIYDRNNVLLASSVPVLSVAINPQKITNINDTLSSILLIFPELDRNILLKNLNSNKTFVWIKRNILPDEEKKINQVGIPGLIFENEYVRIYPHSNTASFILGYVDIDQKGIAGIEKKFNDLLLNEDLYLSIDIRVQNIASNILQEHIRKKRADGGLVIIVDIKNSEILAFVSLPDFNPHYPNRYSSEELFNRASLGVYELGSVWKPISIACAIDYGVIKTKDYFDITPPLRIGKNVINDFSPPRDLLINVENILYRSSNIGTAKIALKMGAEKQRQCFKNFGFFDLVNIGIPEVSKNIFPAKNWSDISVATMSYGHGMAVTPVHFVLSFAALLNNGLLCPVSLVKNNNELSICKNVISEKTSFAMRKLLRGAVVHGGSRRADGKQGDIDDYCVGGKTGTAIKIKNGKYCKKEDLSSFIGGFPMYDPQYLIFVNLDNPKISRIENAAGMSAAPIAKDIIHNIVPIIGFVNDKERCFFDGL